MEARARQRAERRREVEEMKRRREEEKLVSTGRVRRVELRITFSEFFYLVNLFMFF